MFMYKKNIFRILPVLLAALSFNAHSQLNKVDFIRGGFSDAQILYKEYLTPWANSLGANLNGGWYNTAKTHEALGFDVTISVSTAWSPVSARTFEISELNLNGNVTGTVNTAPTVAGSKTDIRPVLSYQESHPQSGEPVTLAEYMVPNGTGMPYLPLPMGQIGLGLSFGTEITGRLLPNLDLGNTGNIGLWGVGLKHSISQWIPVFKELPFLDIAAQGGYTRLQTYANLNFNVDQIAINLVTNPLIFKGQKIEMVAEAYTINLISSQSFPVVSFYEGIGYSNSVTYVGLKGNFPVSRLETNESDENYGKVVVTDSDIYQDPFEVEMQNSKDLRLNAGIRFKFGTLTIHFDYTKANYSVFTAGLGISFR